MPVGHPSLIADALRPFVDQGQLAGAVTLVASRDGILDLGATGFADLQTREPMTPDALFWIASQTKPIVGTAAMMLVDEGKLGLDDPVEKYLPEFQGRMVVAESDETHVLLRPPARPFTVRSLLNHTSGLPFSSLVEHPTLDLLPLWATTRSYAMLPLQSEPGARYLYSNAGINTVGRIIEVLSGQTFQDFLQERLFDPLEMRDTTFWPDDQQMRRLAKSYCATPGGLEETRTGFLHYPLTDRRRRYPFPGGGLFSTAADCASFCRMILRGGELDGQRYLSEASVREMTRRQTAPEITESYGLGWQMRADGEQFGHGGACSTDMNIDLRRGLVTVLLTQLTWTDHGEQMHGAFRRAAEARFGG